MAAGISSVIRLTIRNRSGSASIKPPPKPRSQPTIDEQGLFGHRHDRLSFNRNADGLRKLGRDLVTRAMLTARTPLALRFNEFCHVNVLGALSNDSPAE